MLLSHPVKTRFGDRVGGCKLALPTLGLAKRLGLELEMGTNCRYCENKLAVC